MMLVFTGLVYMYEPYLRQQFYLCVGSVCVCTRSDTHA